MKKSYPYAIIGLVLLMSYLAGGCQAKAQPANPSETIAAPATATQVVEASSTVKAAAATATKAEPTRKPSQTATAKAQTSATPATVQTETITITETATPTEVKIADWSSAKYFTGGPLAHWQYFIALQFDGNLTGSYYAVVDKNKDYKCEILPMYPNRLYCHGVQAAFMDFVNFVVYDAQTNEKVFEDRIWIPPGFYQN